MRLAIVNDIGIAVEALRRVVLSVAGHEVAWIAKDGKEAVERAAADPPDLILMDLIMPVMDGVEATCTIMRSSPCAILIVTASVGGNAAMVFEAMGCGAMDAVKTPAISAKGLTREGRELLRKIDRLGRIIGAAPGGPEKKSRSAAPPRPEELPELIVIGASTGGPKALAQVLAGLPPDLKAAVVIVQHVDSSFAGSLATWLNTQTRLNVELAGPESEPRPGLVLVAGGEQHLVMNEHLGLEYRDEPQETPNRPSVDVFFNSVARHWPGKSSAVLLTGMGRDGAQGLLALKKKGWLTIAQDEASCAVFGMPKAAIQAQAAVKVLNLENIAPALVRNLKNGII